MKSLYLSVYFDDPDTPIQIMLLEIDPTQIRSTGLVRSLYALLKNEVIPAGIFHDVVSFRKDWNQGGEEVAATRGSLFPLSKKDQTLSTVVKQELSDYMKLSTVIDFSEATFQKINSGTVGWLIPQLAWEKKFLYSDGFEGLS
jgi:hypothetical protein